MRKAILPLEYLDSELIAAPLASPAAFQTSLVGLCDRITEPTSRLWRYTERDILSRFPGTSLDELVIRRDRLWFQTAAKTLDRTIPQVLRDGVAQILYASPAGAVTVERRRAWRWLRYALPPDTLGAIVGDAADGIEPVSAPLAQILRDRGFAETHLHLKAALTFATLWVSLQHSLASPEATSDMFKSPGAEFDEGVQLGRWLIRSSLARVLLSAFLVSPRLQSGGLSGYLTRRAVPGMQRQVCWQSGYLVHRALRELAAGRVGNNSPDFLTLRSIYAALVFSARKRPGQPDVGEPSTDPIACYFPPRTGADSEYQFVIAGLRYMKDRAARGGQDGAFERLFWQTIRTRVAFYRHVVQRPMTPGMQWFTRTYARLGPARKPMPERSFVSNAAKISGPGLRSLEVRLVPDDTMPKLFGLMQSLEPAAPASPVEFGVVFHFARLRGNGAQKGCQMPWGAESTEDPGARGNPTHYRFAGYYIERRREAEAFANLLLAFPRMLERVRAVDLCTDELGVPLWVMLPLVRHVHKAGRLAAAALASSRYPVSPLRTTVHAGEAFVHLLGGIRRIAESVEYLNLADGDRIGHGMAVGVNVEEWTMHHPQLAVPRGERLLDLIWAYRVAMRSENSGLKSWLAWISNEAVRIASVLFGESHPDRITELLHWVDDLYEPKSLGRAGFPHGPAPKGKSIIQRWLCSKTIFRNSEQTETVDTRREASLIEALQTETRKMLARKGVAIEINPSSNLLIGHLGDLSNHPLWRMCPPGEAKANDSIRVCIGSDDPVTFATCLPEDYQLLADAMITGGLAMHDADDWLEKARATGMAMRFTTPRSGRSLKSTVGLKRIRPFP
jgi:hypothetical protein